MNIFENRVYSINIFFSIELFEFVTEIKYKRKYLYDIVIVLQFRTQLFNYTLTFMII